MTSGPVFFVQGTVVPVGSQGPSSGVIVRYPNETVELSTGDQPVGITGVVTGFHSLEVSPSGDWWTAVVVYESNASGLTESAIVRNGEVPFYASTGRPTTQDGIWDEVATPHVNDHGVVTFMGIDFDGEVIVRNGRRVFRGGIDALVDVNPNGFALTKGFPTVTRRILLEGLSLDRPGASGVDADGDGSPDPGWSMLGTSSNNQGATFLGDGRVLSLATLRTPSQPVQGAIVLASLALATNTVCEGVANSNGSPASLQAVGTDEVLYNDLQLRIIGVPAGSFMLPLVSNTSHFVPNAGGSFGNLCLGGSIGRGTVVFDDLSTSATYRVYPSVFPQPNGTIAAQAGQTWFFQVWHRDSVSGVGGSNFSSAIGVTFR